MSIPPLVCSTPPPPDQCEEDKDPDDFDITYNLSQDDDDDEVGFGYGDFSSYNHYQSNISQKKELTSKEQEDIIINESRQEDSIDINESESESKEKYHDIVHGSNTRNEIKPKTDEEINVEDLGLELNEESISSSEREDEQSESDHSEKILKVGSDAAVETDLNNSPSSSSSKENVVDTTSIDQFKEKIDGEPIEDTTLDLDNQYSEPNSTSNDELSKNDLSTEENSEPIKETNLDDDFGEFDDFQFVSSERKASVVIIENCDNPWESNEADDGFGDFTANFDSDEKQSDDVKDSEIVDRNSIDEDEDFGDFDDFKSSVVENETTEVVEELESGQQLPVLNFHALDSELQVMESINKVLSSIFEIEIEEPECEFEGKLETQLSETWGHLRETDVRQPYIINWNNSLGQKTLLRALCIDSRNILFGPKWGYNMPKYAVNLSAAPLQPQKPMTPSNPSQSEAAATEKPTTKPGGWTDPFTADGQESCNTDNERVVEVTPTDLDVFEAAISTKSDKIYSNTLNVQPLRQISLPDTHIFTPTDSETPTSKTVHYDSGPPILLPQTVLENANNVDSTNAQAVTSKDNKDDDDYWEFQDFRSSSEKSSITNISSSIQPEPLLEIKTDNGTLKPNVTQQTQVLQPIKIEPLMPTVNWPDPGEIKEVFEDFSDFVSNSAWTDKPTEQISSSQTENITSVETDILDKINDKHKNVETVIETPKLNSHEDFDDDFDTFQSALPPKHIVSEFNFDSLGKNTFDNIPSQTSSQTPDFNHAFPTINSVKSEIISANNLTRPNEALTPSLGNLSNTTELSYNKTSICLGNQMPPSLLQPIHTDSNLPPTQSKQKTSQILQPLSLESYSQINWPNPGIDLQDLSRFNPVETLQSLKSDLSTGGPSKVSSPAHSQKNTVNNQIADDDIWGEFVSSKPKQQATLPKKPASFVDDDEWTEFVSSPGVKPQNGLNTISLNVHTNSNIHKSTNLNKFPTKNNQLPLDIPTLNYITPKASGHNVFNDRHFQNL